MIPFNAARVAFVLQFPNELQRVPAATERDHNYMQTTKARETFQMAEQMKSC
jgi:hypothetical protein